MLVASEHDNAAEQPHAATPSPGPQRTADQTANPEARDAMLVAIPSLRAFALSLTRNPERADNLVQDTIVRAWANIDRFQPGTSITAWLFTILRNRFLSQCRYSRRTVEDPDGAYAGGLRSALGQLSVDQRTALLLVAAEGLSYEDAARVCSVSIGTVKSRVNRARTRLAQSLGVDDAEDLGPDRVTQAALQSAV